MKFKQTEFGRVKKKSIIIAIIIFLVILASSCTNEKSTVQHFTESINYANEATRLRNKGGPYEFMDPEDSGKMLEFMKKALEEARLVNTEILNRRYPDFGNYYRDKFIKGLELFIEGSEENDNIKLLAGQRLDDEWEVWYEQNIDAIRKRK